MPVVADEVNDTVQAPEDVTVQLEPTCAPEHVSCFNCNCLPEQAEE